MACFTRNSVEYSMVSWYDACDSPSGPDNLAYSGSSSTPQLGDTVYITPSCNPGNEFANAFINLDGTPGNVYQTDGNGVIIQIYDGCPLYLSSCTTSTTYEINSGSWAASTSGTFRIEDDSNIPNGCYTFVSPPASFLGTYAFDGSATSQTDCDDADCYPYTCFVIDTETVWAFADDQKLYIDYTNSDDIQVTFTADSNNAINDLYICANNFQNITSRLTYGGVVYSADTYPWTPPPLSFLTGTTVTLSGYSQCTGSTCGPNNETWTLTACCDPSDTIEIEVNLQGAPNVYVFYDATSLGSGVAASASESIRSWFATQQTQQTVAELYEGVIGMPNDNGENWLWWTSYPYLGSLTGGTLSDGITTVGEFYNQVDFAVYNSNYCDGFYSGWCRPKRTEFNDSNSTYQRINRGQDLNTGNPDWRSNGVPFDHTNLNYSATTGPGTFAGGDTNYIVIHIVDEADGNVGLYHGSFLPSALEVFPFGLYGAGWSTSSNPSYTADTSQRFEYDYEQYLKVWEDIKNQNGRVNGLVYPVVTGLTQAAVNNKIPMIPQSVGVIEGETLTTSEYLAKYGENMDDVGPESLNLTALTYTNIYSGFTGLTAYQNLDSNYQNGPGLKNFGISVDPSVTGFSESFVSTKLNSFLSSTDLSQGYGYTYTGTCYAFAYESSGVPLVTVDFSALTENICDTPSCLCPSPTVTPTRTPSVTPTLTPSTSGGVSVSVTPSFTPTQTPSVTPSITPSVSVPCNRLINPSFDIFMSDLGPCPPACTGYTSNTDDSTFCTATQSYTFYPEDCIPGWNTTASQNKIEIWKGGNNPDSNIPAYSGTHFAEINANQATAQSLYQEFTAVSGQQYQIQFAHRGRSSAGPWKNTLKVALSGATSGLVFFPDEYTGLTTSWTLNAINFTASETDYSLVFSATSNEAGGNFLDAIDVVCPQNFVTPSPTPTMSITPTPSGTNSCYNASVQGNYFYIDCCKVYHSGYAANPEQIIIDTSYTYSADVITIGSVTSQNCNYGPLDYTFDLTGTCDTGFGTLIITPTGGVPPYTLDNIVPGTLTGGTSVYPFEYTGLTTGTYTFRLNDSLGNQNNEKYINVNVDGCLEAIIDDYSGTTCGNDNGFVSVSGNSTSLPYVIDLYKNSILDQSVTSSVNPTEFYSLSDGTYYAFVTDDGGATAQTQNVVISGSSLPEFGLSVTGTSSCGFNDGVIVISGLTGVSPFTYLWSNGETTSSISGLSANTYSVTVTDANGCDTTNSGVVPTVGAIDLISYTTIPAGCLTADGILTVYISGGTAPYTYVGQNGYSGVTSSQNFTFTGCSAGPFEFTVTDTNNCTYTDSVNISSLGGLVSVSYSVNYTNCNSKATLTIDANGTGAPFTYGYTGQTVGGTSSVTTSNTQVSFPNLAFDTYDITVESSNGCCYSDTVVLSATPKYDLTVSTTGATCGGSAGVAHIEVGTGYTIPLDYVLSDGQNILGTTLSGYTFYNLPQGGYTIEVSDASGCQISETFLITGNTGVNVVLTKVECTPTTLGSIEANVLSGDAPFTYLWSNGETGSTISGLTADTYSVTVTDTNGCEGSASIDIICSEKEVTSFPIYNICSDIFTSTIKKRGFIEMAGDGYLELTDNLTLYTGCTFNYMIFNYDITFSGQNATGSFYTGYTISDVPSDQLWADTIESVLTGFTGIEAVETDIINNTIKMTGECNNHEIVNIDLKIDYNLDCSIIPQPSPTITPSITMTPTNTITPSITQTVTTSVTPSVTATPTITPTTTITPSVTPSVTTTVTPSVTPSITTSVTPTTTITPSVTPSVTTTVTPSITPSITTSVTPSNTTTPTVSVSVSTTPSTSVSLSPTVTPSVTPTTTPSITVSQTPSASISVTPTMSPSVSLTPTNSVSVSPSLTPSNTPTTTPSVTISQTPGASISVTPTVSMTPTVTPSVSPSISPSISVSVTPSISVSASVTPTTTPSVTISQTPGASVSATVTPSVTPTVTPSVSPSLSPSISISATPSVSITPSVTSSITPSVTPSVTTTVSTSITPSVSISPTVSVTPGVSITATPSITVSKSVSATPSVSPTPSISITSSVTPTSSVSATPSITISKSISATPSVSPTPSITISKSVSATPSVTVTPSITISKSVSATPSISITSSVTPTPTVSPTPSITISKSISATPSVTVTPSITISKSVSATPSISITSSVTPTPTVSPTPSITISKSISATPSVSITPSYSITPSVSLVPSVTPTRTITPQPSPSANYIEVYFSACCETSETSTYKMSVNATVANEISQSIFGGRSTFYLQNQFGISDQCIIFYEPPTGLENNLGVFNGQLIDSTGNPWGGDPSLGYQDCSICTSAEEHPCVSPTYYQLKLVGYNGASGCSLQETIYVAQSTIGSITNGNYVKVSQDSNCYQVIGTTTTTPTYSITSQNSDCQFCDTGIVAVTQVIDFTLPQCQTDPNTTYYADTTGLSTKPAVNEFILGDDGNCYLVNSYAINQTTTITATGGPYSLCNGCLS